MGKNLFPFLFLTLTVTPRFLVASAMPFLISHYRLDFQKMTIYVKMKGNIFCFLNNLQKSRTFFFSKWIKIY